VLKPNDIQVIPSMKLRTLFWTFLVAVIIFFFVVKLGMKYQWVEYLRDDTQRSDPSVPLPQQTNASPNTNIPDTQNGAGTTNEPKPELLEEGLSDLEVVESRIRKDCIDASRNAGVPEAELQTIVDACVALTQDNNELPDATHEHENGKKVDTYAEGLEVTRKACEIVAAEEKGLTPAEKKKMVEECVAANIR
jgi:hypothetical protein